MTGLWKILIPAFTDDSEGFKILVEEVVEENWI